MKRISFTNVKNEADIIETFVRHNLQYLDYMYIADNLSTDGTGQILSSLIAEGLPIEVWVDDVIAWDQSFKSTKALTAINKAAGDSYCLVFLDADEMILGDLSIPDTADRVLAGELSRFRYVLPDRNHQGTEVFLEMAQRSDHLESSKSVLVVPFGSVISNLRVSAGSHYVYQSGSRLDYAFHAGNLGHFAVRSMDQYARKVVLGWYALLRMNYRNGLSSKPIGIHWRNGTQFLLKHDFKPSWDEFRDYVEPAELTNSASYHPLEQPLLKYSQLGNTPQLPVLLSQFIESCLLEYGEKTERLNSELSSTRLRRISDLLRYRTESINWTKVWIWTDRAAVFDWSSHDRVRFAFDIYCDYGEIQLQLVTRSGIFPQSLLDKFAKASIPFQAIGSRENRVVLWKHSTDYHGPSDMELESMSEIMFSVIRVVDSPVGLS